MNMSVCSPIISPALIQVCYLEDTWQIFVKWMNKSPESPWSSDRKEDSPLIPSSFTRGQVWAHPRGDPESSSRGLRAMLLLSLSFWGRKVPSDLGKLLNFGFRISLLKEWKWEINSDLYSLRLQGLTQQDLQSAFKIQCSELRQQAAVLEGKDFPARGVTLGPLSRRKVILR